jgi:hypothetical protein
MTAAEPSVQIAQRVLQILEDGAFTATYKQAVLVGLMDLCLELTKHDGVPPDWVTTRQLAEKIIELYWPQTRRYDEERQVLAQNNQGRPHTGRAWIVQRIHGFRERQEEGVSGVLTVDQARAGLPKSYETLLRQVEWKLIEMPLPKLQRVAGLDTNWLYTIGWDDSKEGLPSKTEINAYQAGKTHGFDNLIRFQPGVAGAFVALHGILRPFVLQHWSAKVARLNRLEESRLPEFLFGVDRSALAAVRRPLAELQDGRCFYCGEPLRGGVDVDHFIPWARNPDNGLHNLVVADAACNHSKRDFLASARHVAAWRRRSRERAGALERIADRETWPLQEQRTLGVARALYLNLQEDARLWDGKGARRAVILPGDPVGIRRLLG